MIVIIFLIQTVENLKQNGTTAQFNKELKAIIFLNLGVYDLNRELFAYQSLYLVIKFLPYVTYPSQY